MAGQTAAQNPPQTISFEEGLNAASPPGGDTSTGGSPSILSKVGGFGKDVAKGLGESAVGLMSTGDEFARKHLPAFLTNSNMGFGPPANLQHIKDAATPANTTQAVSKGLGDAAQFMIPGGAEEKLASLAPKAIAPIARIGASALGAGLVNKAQGGGFGTGAAMGAGGAAVGQGLKAVAPALAETALHVRGNQRLFGRTVGDAILNDTSGIRPATVARTAKQTMSDLGPELDAADAQSAQQGLRGSLKPAREDVADTIAGHTANRAVATAGHIQPVADFLAKDQVTGLPLAENQTAPGLRSIKRGLNSDYIGNWSPTQPPAQKGAARSAYGQINSELHRISPETAGIDQRISSLIPVAQQGERVASEAPFLQRAVGRIARPTGGLAPAITGGYIGSKEGGLKGGLVGGALGLAAPELIASPEGQMILARTLNKSGALRPVIGAALQADRKKEDQ